jgi:hypothetical protein
MNHLPKMNRNEFVDLKFFTTFLFSFLSRTRFDDTGPSKKRSEVRGFDANYTWQLASIANWVSVNSSSRLAKTTESSEIDFDDGATFSLNCPAEKKKDMWLKIVIILAEKEDPPFL